MNHNDHIFPRTSISHTPDIHEINFIVTMMLSCGWSGGGQGGREESRRESAGGGTELLQSCRLRSSSFLNSLAPKKVSAQQIADEITPRLSLFPGSCQTPVGQFCPPATGQAWKRRNLQTFLGNFCYGERELTFESYTWCGLAGTACSCS